MQMYHTQPDESRNLSGQSKMAGNFVPSRWKSLLIPDEKTVTNGAEMLQLIEEEMKYNEVMVLLTQFKSAIFEFRYEKM